MGAQTAADGSAFDYIIVGAGSAGAVLAGRLSADPAVSVCLIEAGPPDKHTFLHVPFGLAGLSKVPGISWSYETTPQLELGGRRLHWPRGKTLGGSSSINAMCYIRGAPEDYDGWAEQGATGWGWASVLPYFRRSEDQERGADDYHAIGGPLSVSDLRHVSPLSRAFAEAGGELQLHANPDFNGERQDGLGLYQVTQTAGRRCSTARAYLRPAAGRSNLAILTESFAEAVLFEGRKARGVRLSRGGETLHLKAEREVLLCGGAVNSPQLLMLSGIGPAAHLTDFGIAPIADRPGVGQNLQDHLDATLQHSTRSRAGYAIAVSALPAMIWGVLNYALRKRGFLTSNIAEAGGFARVRPDAALPEVQFHFLPVRIENHGRSRVFGYGYSLHTCCLQPKSRGEIRLASSDPVKPPAINPRYLDHEDDARIMIEGLRLGRRILAAPAFDPYRGPELDPGPDMQSDAELLAFIRARAETIYHPVGTCRMGRADDPGAVVDPELKVIGTEGLRVVDASVMPSLIRGNTNAPTIMIAERAADLIVGRGL
ncbi:MULTISPECIES: choline dehydrogenase [Rhodomicrobium]|uniref:GMC family oxidoreductase n=1 Tax=Rhodomicrobium TaxID=1068 RepID=UPI000B4AB713|nr:MULTISPECIES: choline dehydrogenase [Rhodomicrobium]